MLGLHYYDSNTIKIKKFDPEIGKKLSKFQPEICIKIKKYLRNFQPQNLDLGKKLQPQPKLPVSYKNTECINGYAKHVAMVEIRKSGFWAFRRVVLTGPCFGLCSSSP